jgi:hypothetical protein
MKPLLIAGIALSLLSASYQTKASVLLDWASVAPADRMLQPTVPHPGVNGTYTTGADFKGIDVRVAGSDFAKQGSGLHDPKIDPKGHPYPAPVLSSVAEFRPQITGTNATVEFTIDFFGFKQGVKDVAFTLFNVDDDHSATKKVQDVVTFKTAGLSLTGSQDNVVSGNTVTGIGSHGPASTGGPQSEVFVKSSGGLPLHQIVFDWQEKILPGNKDFFEEIAVGNVIFTPVPEVGQLGVGLVACLLGGLWLAYNRRKLSA